MKLQGAVKMPEPISRYRGFFGLATFVLVVAVMKIAQEVLVPIALTILLTFLLTPFVVRLMKVGLPKTVAILIVVASTFAVIGTAGLLVVNQLSSLVQDLPNYEVNIQTKISRLKNRPSQDAFTRLESMVKKIEREVDSTSPEPKTPRAKSGPNAQPVPVEVAVHHNTEAELVTNFIGPLIQPLGTALVVIVFVITMLFQREDLRDRFIKVVSAGRLNLATQALDDASQRVTRYLLLQLFVNVCYGVPVGLGLYYLGVPHAMLWAVLATLLRFIPFIGPWIAAVFPAVLAAAIDPGWSKMIYTLGVFGVMEIITPNLIEPWLYGKGTGISNLALLVAAVFWTWLWGLPGLFLSTPLTVCIMVMGKYVTGLQFLSVLLGSEPVLEPAARFYQRMLSMDSDEMLAIATQFIEDRSIDEFYNDVFIPALFMAEQDRHSGSLAEVRQKFIFERSRELIDTLERKTPMKQIGNEKTEKAEKVVGPHPLTEDDEDRLPVVYGVPAQDDADEVVAMMLQHLLRMRGIETEVVPASVHAEDSARWIKKNGVRVVFVSALPPSALLGARQTVRRLKEVNPDISLVVGIWDRHADFEEIKIRLRNPRPTAIVTDLSEAVRQIEKLIKAVSPEGVAAIEEAKVENEGSSADFQFAPLGLDQVEPDELLGVIVRDISQHFGVPVSLVALTTSDAGFWKSRIGVSPDDAKTDESSAMLQSICADDLVVVDDVTKDRRFVDQRALSERGVKFYGSVPLRDRSGRAVGCLTVLDTKPRNIGERGRLLLASRAKELMEAVDAPKPEAVEEKV